MSASSGLALPKPARGSAKRERARKRRAKMDAGYTEFIHAQPCLVSGCRAEVEQHHERDEGFGNGDWDSVPLCSAHHRGKYGRHGLQSRSEFEVRYGIRLAEEIRRLRGEYEVLYGPSRG
jgi:hypothetical protein